MHPVYSDFLLKKHFNGKNCTFAQKLSQFVCNSMVTHTKHKFAANVNGRNMK